MKRERFSHRERFDFEPTWKGEIEGWVVNYIHKNLWRVRPHHDFDDLFQDAYVYFLIVEHRYAYVFEAPHFFALFRTCFVNHVTHLANQRTARNEVSAQLIGIDGEPLDLYDFATTEHIDELEVEDDLAHLDEEAMTPDLRKLVEGCGAHRRPRTFRKRPGGGRETTNEFLCRIARIDPSTNLRDQLENYLDGRPNTEVG